MTSTMTTTAEQVVRKHPVRGALWGLLLGLGLAIYAILFAIIPFTDWVPLILVVLAGVVIGVAWAYLAPAKKPGPPPAAPATAPAQPEPMAAAEEPLAGGADPAAVAEPVADVPGDSDAVWGAADGTVDAGPGDDGPGDDGPGVADDPR